jgi:TPR repeat protein
MSERTIESPQFITCLCEHCGGGIEFDASEFVEHESRVLQCPHCSKETKIFVPVQKLPSGISAEELSDLGAWNNIGLYFSGQITSEDHVNALKYFHRAAEHGLQDAQNNLGRAYNAGKGVPMDQVEAVKWFRLAAEQGHIFGQFNLGLAYLNGKGVPENLDEAVKWFRLAAEQGEPTSQGLLGCVYSEGKGGLAKDQIEAVKWWRKAAEQGNRDAQHNVGHAYAHGEGVPNDKVEAAKWYLMAAEQGQSSAQLNLGCAYAVVKDCRKIMLRLTNGLIWLRQRVWMARRNCVII